MTSLHAQLNLLEAQLCDELAAKAREATLLERQLEAVRQNSSSALEAVTLELEGELERGGERARKRDRIFAALAQHFGVRADTLTLSSIAQRADERGVTLHELRDELRAATARVVKLHRQVHAFVRVHRGIVHDALTLLFAPDGGGQVLAAPGNLVDAKA